MMTEPADAVEALDAYSRVVTAVADRLLPSVASLSVRGKGGAPRGAGSAVVLTGDGVLVTSAHVVGQSSGGVLSLADGREFDFTVAGADPLSDLAVVRAAASGLVPAALGDADHLRIGELVVAIGNPLGYSGSVSAGVVSGLGRSLTTQTPRSARLVENVIQTDAALHPGNSGGALANARGEVVGINTAVAGPMIGQGLGLAVPVNALTQGIMSTLLSHGRVRRAYLGVAGGSRPTPPRVARDTGREQAIEVLTVVSGSPADAAGLRTEDLILEVDGAPTPDVGALQRLLTAERIGQPTSLSVVRAGALQRLTATPTELPD